MKRIQFFLFAMFLSFALPGCHNRQAELPENPTLIVSILACGQINVEFKGSVSVDWSFTRGHEEADVDRIGGSYFPKEAKDNEVIREIDGNTSFPPAQRLNVKRWKIFVVYDEGKLSEQALKQAANMLVYDILPRVMLYKDQRPAHIPKPFVELMGFQQCEKGEPFSR
jgi:hypothetical protein